LRDVPVEASQVELFFDGNQGRVGGCQSRELLLHVIKISCYIQYAQFPATE
jgi:hypothetical protein